MKTSDETTAPAAEKHGQIWRFVALSVGFWRMEQRGRAWRLTFLMLMASSAQIGVNLIYNAWNKWFFDALEARDTPLVVHYILLFIPMICAAAAVGTIVVAGRMTLQMRWREWLSRRMLGWWIADQRYYRLTFVAPEFAAPEYRIAEDVRLAVEPLVEFALGLASAAVTAAAFAAILWKVAGSIEAQVGGVTIVVPAYMAIAAIVYAAVVSWASYFTGRPLANVVGNKNELEASFRSEMTRLRENGESVALVRGDEDERAAIEATYDKVVAAWRTLIRRQGIVGVVTNTNAAIYPILPLLLLAPKYLSGQLSLGDVMQVASAFAAVQGALIWFVDNFVRLSECYASMRRVNELADVLDGMDNATQLSGGSNIEISDSDDDTLHLENLMVAHSGGAVVIAESSTIIARGERVLITGESGTGKSTLIRAIAGLWPWGSGRIRLPAGASISFMPQKPYIPLGTLRNALLYPLAQGSVDDAALMAAMRDCGLGYLSKQLDDEQRWDQSLSGGERQRVAFARLTIQKPDIIIMDEATSALDEDSQTSMLNLIHDRLSEATIISVGHRPGLEEYHTRKLTLERHSAGASMSSHEVKGGFLHLLRKIKNEVIPYSGK